MLNPKPVDYLLKYQASKQLLNVRQRYLDIFEFRHGLVDGAMHTLKTTGQKFGTGPERIRQIEARVLYELENLYKNDPVE